MNNVMGTHKQWGVSLLELMLVIVIAMIIILMSLRFYALYKKTGDIGLLESNVGQVMAALNEYYYANCNKADPAVTEVSLSDLYQAGLLQNQLYNPWGTFFVKIINTSNDQTNPFYVLQVGVTIDNLQKITPTYAQALANYIRGSLNGDPATVGLLVTWTRLPTHATEDVTSHQWVFNQGPGQVIMPGRYMTAMNTGMNSTFWVMDSGEQLFSLQQQLHVPGINNSVCPN
jgi:Tfp pilus assembly protein PilE